MTARSTFRIPIIVCLSFSASLFGQIDSNELRAKYGLPLDRETFTISPDFQVIVDYGPDQQVCRLELPASVPSITAQRVDDILLELVPMSMRGKNLGTMFVFMGRPSIKIPIIPDCEPASIWSSSAKNAAIAEHYQSSSTS